MQTSPALLIETWCCFRHCNGIEKNLKPQQKRHLISHLRRSSGLLINGGSNENAPFVYIAQSSFIRSATRCRVSVSCGSISLICLILVQNQILVMMPRLCPHARAGACSQGLKISDGLNLQVQKKQRVRRSASGVVLLTAIHNENAIWLDGFRFQREYSSVDRMDVSSSVIIIPMSRASSPSR